MEKFALFYLYILGTKPEMGKLETDSKLNNFVEYLAVLNYLSFLISSYFLDSTIFNIPFYVFSKFKINDTLYASNYNYFIFILSSYDWELSLYC